MASVRRADAWFAGGVYLDAAMAGDGVEPNSPCENMQERGHTGEPFFGRQGKGCSRTIARDTAANRNRDL